MRTYTETVVARRSRLTLRRRGTPRIHYVDLPYEVIDGELYEPDDGKIAHTPSVCGQKPAKEGWLVIPEGLDHPEYGISHVMCDRCFDRFVGPQH